MHGCYFGVAPDRPDTGFGYIANGAALGDNGYAVARFVEKPPLAEAEAMLAAVGLIGTPEFFCSAPTRCAAMTRHCPAILAAAERGVENATTDRDAQFVHVPSKPRLPYRLIAR